MDYIKQYFNKVKNTYLTYRFITYNKFVTDHAVMLELLFSNEFPKKYTKYDRADFDKAVQNALLLDRYCHNHNIKLDINIPALFMMRINNENDCKMYIDLFS